MKWKVVLAWPERKTFSPPGASSFISRILESDMTQVGQSIFSLTRLLVLDLLSIAVLTKSIVAVFLLKQM